MQISPSVKLEITHCESDREEYWLTTLVLYQMLLLAMLVYFNVKDSKMKDIRSHVEESAAGTRIVVAISITTLVTLSTYRFLQTDFDYYRALHWLHVVYTVIAPPSYILVVFIPKVML
jgi:uncharacterized membrane protein YhaH (DUF805 family)